MEATPAEITTVEDQAMQEFLQTTGPADYVELGPDLFEGAM